MAGGGARGGTADGTVNGGVAAVGAEECCVDVCCAPPTLCCNAACEAVTCSLSVGGGSVCPGGSVELDGVAICDPSCVSMSITAEIVEPGMQGYATVSVLPSGVACGPFKTPIVVTVTASPDAPVGSTLTVRLTGRIMAAFGLACEATAEAMVPVTKFVDLTFDTVPEDQEEVPGGYLCVNGDDDDNNGTPDKDDAGPTPGEDDLRPLTVSLDGSGGAGTVTLECVAGCSRVRVFENPDRSGAVVLPITWTVPSAELPKTLYIEGLDGSAAERDVTLRVRYTGDGGPCEDDVNLTTCLAELHPVTSGAIPIPMNPAIVAPMTPLLLDDGTLWWDANTFGLTKFRPDVDLRGLPVTWTFNVTSGFVTPQAQTVVAPDRRSARLEIPYPSWGNLGQGRMEFRVGGKVCADVSTLIKNVQGDLEPGDFRFLVKAHLCTDGLGTSTWRTEAEVRTIMSDVTKVLSQCGIIVTTSSVVSTIVPTGYVDDLGSLVEKNSLFGYEADAAVIDVYFVKTIDSGDVAGVTLTPVASNSIMGWLPGVAIADGVGPNGAIALQGQDVVRTLAHEITHYLLNHYFPETSDHRNEDENLMYWDTIDTKRDLDEGQCLEIRSNRGGN